MNHAPHVAQPHLVNFHILHQVETVLHEARGSVSAHAVNCAPGNTRALELELELELESAHKRPIGGI